MTRLVTTLFLAALSFSSDGVFGSVASVTIRNRSETDRLQWVHTTIPFAKGRVQSEAELANFSVGHGSIDWRVLKWHMTDGVEDSIALASLKMPVYLSAYAETTVDVVEEPKPNEIPFDYGANLRAVLNRGTLLTDIVAVAKLKNDPQLYAAFFLQNPRAVFDGPQSKCISFHSNFGEQALSMTIWMDVNNRQDFGNFVIAIGNQTFERPHSGGIDVEYVDLYVNLPLQVEIRHGADYGAEAP
ncbi:MAG: hypothetical protein O7G83_01090 [Proteobacteria bacterium]|nr:hypothetical protein [Pseudomonadota bacterium]